MITGHVIRRNEYYDSLFLMRVAKRVSEQRGVLQAAAFMGTEKNKGLLAQMGFGNQAVLVATPTDLILAVKAENQEALDEVLGRVEDWLRPELIAAGTPSVHTLDEALIRQPHSNLAVLSVPGAYAAREARKALDAGLNVFLFSDNVPVEEESALKAFARERGLMVMGPDCGTAIIGGVGIGFANAVRRGPIGVIGASGAGIQEFTCLVHQAGSGISHAIGTGSRDLSDAIGGISTVCALEALERDTRTEVIAILSKPPGPQALSRLSTRLAQCPKPFVTCFLGLKEEPSYGEGSPYRNTRTLEEAAVLAVHAAGGGFLPRTEDDPDRFQVRIRSERERMRPEQKYIRGLFAGGTFCYQAQQVLRDAGIVVHSNGPLAGNPPLKDPLRSEGHSLVDMGADEFTVGRPHPMLDPRLRNERILAEAEDPQMAILLLDFILGFNARPDPAGDGVPAILEAKRKVEKRGGNLSVLASVCGTAEDPQGLALQVRTLEEAGVLVFSNSASAARFSGSLAAVASEVPGVRSST